MIEVCLKMENKNNCNVVEFTCILPFSGQMKTFVHQKMRERKMGAQMN